MSLLDISDAFWSRHIWLPANCTWDDLANKDPAVYKPQTNDLLYALPLALLATAIRFSVELYLLKPMARYFKFVSDEVLRAYKTTSKRSPGSPGTTVVSSGVLEAVYNSGNRHPSSSEIHWLANELKMTDVNVATWFAIRRNQDRPPVESRFIDSGAKALYFLTMQLIGLSVLWDKTWLWNTRDCWLNYPDIHVPSGLFWYYMLAIGCYLSSAARLLLTRPWPKTFTEKMTYHLVTLALLSISWSANLVRFGSLVLLCHDGLPDFFIELAKIMRYLGAKYLSNLFFVIATALWFAVRLAIFPFHVARSLLIEARLAIPIYVISNFLLFSMLAMHISKFIRMLGIAADRIFAPFAD